MNNQINNQCNEYKYVVKKDDTLYKISREMNVSLDTIFHANPDVNVYNLQPGDILCIPDDLNSFFFNNSNRNDFNWPNNSNPANNPNWMNNNPSIYKVFVVKKDDTLKDVLNKTGVSMKDLIDANLLNGIRLQEGSILNIPQSTFDENMDD